MVGIPHSCFCCLYAQWIEIIWKKSAAGVSHVMLFLGILSAWGAVVNSAILSWGCFLTCTILVCNPLEKRVALWHWGRGGGEQFDEAFADQGEVRIHVTSLLFFWCLLFLLPASIYLHPIHFRIYTVGRTSVGIPSMVPVQHRLCPFFFILNANSFLSIGW
jgi:hypothetical protein